MVVNDDVHARDDVFVMAIVILEDYLHEGHLDHLETVRLAVGVVSNITSVRLH